MKLEIYSLVTFPRLAVEIPILLVIYVHTVKPIRPGKTPLLVGKKKRNKKIFFLQERNY